METCYICGEDAKYLGCDIYGPCHRECKEKQNLKSCLLAVSVGMGLLAFVWFILPLIK
jgi:ribosomal protein L14